MRFLVVDCISLLRAQIGDDDHLQSVEVGLVLRVEEILLYFEHRADELRQIGMEKEISREVDKSFIILVAGERILDQLEHFHKRSQHKLMLFQPKPSLVMYL